MSAAIPLLDLEAQHAPLREALRGAFDRVLRAGAFILGPEVSALEQELCEALGVGHAVGVSSGTDAILVSLMALGVEPGDEVVTTPFSFFATAGCISRLGARPVFVDVEPDTLCLDARGVGRAVGARTRALLPVHLFGRPCDVAALRSAAGASTPIVEDAAQAICARSPQGPVGALGEVGCFSFFPSKNLGGFGDGGLVTTREGALAAKVRLLRAHGAEPKYFHAEVGGNFRLDALQAALLRVKLPHLPAYTQARRRHAALYDDLFAEAALGAERLRTPKADDGHVYNQYVVRAERRDALAAHLRARGIGSAIYYPRPLHLQACFASLGYGPGDFPEAERACAEVLALPVYPELGEAAVRRVVAEVVSFYEP